MKSASEKSAETTTTTVAQAKGEPFFGKQGGRGFFEGTKQNNAPIIQAKLTINEPGDVYEQEADRVADRVMRMRESDHPFVQRKPIASVKTPAPAQNNSWTPLVQYAVDFVNSIEVSKRMNEAWKNSSPGTDEAKEWSGAMVERAGNPLALNVKEGKSFHSKPQIKGGEIDKKTDVVKGDFHTHPYTPEEIERVTGAYKWDGQGLGPSGGDFESIKSESTGYFMVIESGTVRYLIVLTDAAKFNAHAYLNLEKAVDDEISKSVLNKDNMEKNPAAKTPMPYTQAFLQGVVNAFNQMKKDAGVDDIGITLLKTTDTEKTAYETVF